MIVILLVAFAALTTFLLFRVEGSVLVKTLTSAMLFLAASLTYFSVNGIRGWPTTQDLPSDGFVVAVDVYEPENDQEGGVYLWVKYDFNDALFLFEPPDPLTPRAFKIPYTEQNARAAAQMKEALKNGMLVDLESVSAGDGVGDGGDDEGFDKSVGFYLEETRSKFKVLNPAEIMRK